MNDTAPTPTPTPTMLERIDAFAAEMENAYEGRLPHRKPGWAKPLITKAATGLLPSPDCFFPDEKYMSTWRLVDFVREARDKRMDEFGNVYGPCNASLKNSKTVFATEVTAVPYGAFDAWVKSIATVSKCLVDWMPEPFMHPELKVTRIQLVVKTNGNVTAVHEAIDSLLHVHDLMYYKAAGIDRLISVNSPGRRFARCRIAHAIEHMNEKLDTTEKKMKRITEESLGKDILLRQLSRDNEFLTAQLKAKSDRARAFHDVGRHLREAVESMRFALLGPRDEDSDE